MAPNRSGFVMVMDTLTPGIASFSPKMQLALGAATEYQAGECEGYMKSNAPWTDRTSNARNGLFARPEVGAGSFVIHLGHSVPYGIYLETRWSGRYAIILPTVQTKGPEFMQLAAQVMSRMT